MKKRKLIIEDQGSLMYNEFKVFARKRKQECKDEVQISSDQSSPLQSQSLVFYQRKEVNQSEDTNGETKCTELGYEPDDLKLWMASTVEDNISPIGSVQEQLAEKNLMIASLKAELAQRDKANAEEKLISVKRIRMISELKDQVTKLCRASFESHQKDEIISLLETESIQKSTAIVEKDNLIAGKDATIAFLKSESIQKDNFIVEKDKLIREKNDMIADLKDQIVQKDNIIVEKDKLIGEKDEMIAKHKVEARQIDNKLAEMNKLISEKDDAIIKEQNELEFFIDRVIDLNGMTKALEQRAVKAEELVLYCLKKRKKAKARIQRLQGKIKDMQEVQERTLLMAQIQAVEEFKSSNEYRDAMSEYAKSILEGALSDLHKRSVD